MSWRQQVRALHRDIGYAVFALTLAYACSGLAVNHIEDWNPNYVFEETPIAVGALPADDLAAMEAQVVQALGIAPDQVRGRFMESQRLFRVYLRDGEEVRVDPSTGDGVQKRVKTRPVLYEINSLHLNNLKGVWTWVADLYALLLIVLACTGLLIHKGRQGVLGRGKWFVAAGFAVPVLFVVYLYFGASP